MRWEIEYTDQFGGDKTDRWHEFYAEMIPIADQLYDEHLNTLQREGLI